MKRVSLRALSGVLLIATLGWQTGPALADDLAPSDYPLKPNQTFGFGHDRLLVFTYRENFACVHQPHDDRNYNGIPAQSDPGEFQTPICQVGAESDIDPTGIPVERSEPLYVLVPMFSLNDDTNPDDAFTPALGTTAGDRLLATGGITEIEGSAGGGITPWALIDGLETEDQIGGSISCTRVEPQDFRLDSCGFALGIRNRLELSADRIRFDLGDTVPGQSIRLDVFGAKVQLFGDAVFDQDRWWPQLAVGVQWKRNEDFDLVPKALGATHADGADFYVAATKVWLDGPLGHSWLADATLRASEANQLGILGFGGDRGAYHLLAEGSVGIFVTDQLIAGAEYRQKPSNLSAYREDDFRDLFIAYFPVKYLAVTAAFADLGNIANEPGERGYYLSLQGSW